MWCDVMWCKVKWCDVKWSDVITRWCDHLPRARHLEWEVKWALGSITTNKASGGDGISVELFEIQKDDAVKVLHSICQQIWKTQQWPQDWNQFSFKSQRMFKPPHNCTHLTREQSNVQNSPSQASTVHELGTSRCSSWIQKRQRDQRSNCQQLSDHQKSKRLPEKHLLQLYWLPQSLSLCGSQKTVENS